MKKQILFVIMLMCTLSAVAVKLPSGPYKSGATGSQVSYTTGSGITFMNQSTVGDYIAGTCSKGELKGDAADQHCEACCEEQYQVCEVLQNGDCDELKKACINDCMGYSLPLDAPTAFLLALVAAYGAVAVYRRKMQQA